ncbi:MAG: hypothetical protein MJZ26_12630 [Fibrobacter sp.]|nr:hypothetical protein [Fibrobacter sp.]
MNGYIRKLLGLFLAAILFAGCTEMGERDNINDPYYQEIHSCSSIRRSSSSSKNYVYFSSSSYIDPSQFFSSSSKQFMTADDYLNPDFDYGEIVDKRDNRRYKTTTVGRQTWMAQNLNYSDSTASPNLKGQSWCFDHDIYNCEKYGRLYTWSAAMDIDSIYLRLYYPQEDSMHHQGICPEGFRIPTADDLHELFLYTQERCEFYYVDICWRSSYGWKLELSDSVGTDIFGLSVLPSGERFLNHDFNYEIQKYVDTYEFRYLNDRDNNNRTSFFTSTEDKDRRYIINDTAYNNRVFANDIVGTSFRWSDIDTLSRWKTTASAIRCIKIED